MRVKYDFLAIFYNSNGFMSSFFFKFFIYLPKRLIIYTVIDIYYTINSLLNEKLIL